MGSPSEIFEARIRFPPDVDRVLIFLLGTTSTRAFWAPGFLLPFSKLLPVTALVCMIFLLTLAVFSAKVPILPWPDPALGAREKSALVATAANVSKLCTLQDRSLTTDGLNMGETESRSCASDSMSRRAAFCTWAISPARAASQNDSPTLARTSLSLNGKQAGRQAGRLAGWLAGWLTEPRESLPRTISERAQSHRPMPRSPPRYLAPSLLRSLGAPPRFLRGLSPAAP
mmetsp:Transcript_9429/g.16513  ORF Transcript_9429/g.16513 Transcript_9429/m.16513 type:complete len:229 (-) Transcript_9429:91-777(-)